MAESFGPFIGGLQTWMLPYLIIAGLVLSTFYYISTTVQDGIPLVNPPKWFQPRIVKQLHFMSNSLDEISRGRENNPGKPFRLLTGRGEILVLPADFAHKIRNESRLDFRKLIFEEFHAYLPGFEPFRTLHEKPELLNSVIRNGLTKNLEAVTEALTSESSFAGELIFGNSADTEWHEVQIHTCILDLVTRVSSRVLVGEELCREEAWLKIAKEYTIHSFKAIFMLSIVPASLRSIFQWLSTDCSKVRQNVRDASSLINRLIDKRRELRRQALYEGKHEPYFNDAIDWAEKESNGQAYDAVRLQLMLSVTSIHTMADLCLNALVLLAGHREFIEPLRNEMAECLRREGCWAKSAIDKLPLLDSAIKEAQRVKPVELLTMARIALEDVQLADGIRVRKGERISVDNFNMINPDLHEDPQRFDIYRFIRLRERPEWENKVRLVSTSPEHLGFGYGISACTGRFFAAFELKILLCHLVLKYDWKLVPGTVTQPIVVGITRNVNPNLRLMVRRRMEELKLDSW